MAVSVIIYLQNTHNPFFCCLFPIRTVVYDTNPSKVFIHELSKSQFLRRLPHKTWTLNSQHENDIAKNSLCDDSFLSFSVCNAAYRENEKLLKSFLEPNNLIIRRKPPRESNSSIFVQNASMYSPCFSRNRSHNEHFEQFSHSKLNRKAK